MKFNSILYACLICNGGSFSNIENFVNFTLKFSDNPHTPDETTFLNELSRVMERIQDATQDCLIGGVEAKNLMVYFDLLRLNDILNCSGNWYKFDLNLDAFYEQYNLIFSEIGIDVDNVLITTVDKFPHPYTHLKGAALCPDLSDELKYNIKSGIYFKVDQLVPIKTQLTLGHELVHIAIGRNNHELLARGLEEGICEFIGILYCGLKVYDESTILNYFIYRRLKYTNHVQKFKLYMDYFRMATFIYNNYGIEGITHLIKGGRKLIKSVEIQLSNNNFKDINLPGYPVDKTDEIYRLSNYIAMLYSENEVISPLSYLVSMHLSKFDGGINEVISNLNLDYKQAIQATEDIESRVFGLLLNDDHIEYSDIGTLLQLNTYRYEI